MFHQIKSGLLTVFHCNNPLLPWSFIKCPNWASTLKVCNIVGSPPNKGLWPNNVLSITGKPSSKAAQMLSWISVFSPLKEVSTRVLHRSGDTNTTRVHVCVFWTRDARVAVCGPHICVCLTPAQVCVFHWFLPVMHPSDLSVHVYVGCCVWTH